MQIFALIMLVFCGKIVISASCFWNNYYHSNKYFASKSPYNIIRGDLRDNIIKIKGEMFQLFMLSDSCIFYHVCVYQKSDQQYQTAEYIIIFYFIGIYEVKNVYT